MASAVTQILGDGIFDGIAKIISLFKISPEQAAANSIELQKIRAEMLDGAQKAAQAQIDDATANITTEAKSGSKARPAFMWIIESILAFNYIVAPLFNMGASMLHRTEQMQTLSLPTNLLALFAVCLTGYTAFDKVGELMNLPGLTQISVPGIQISNDTGKKGKK
jgi:hypothetical protein